MNLDQFVDKLDGPLPVDAGLDLGETQGEERPEILLQRFFPGAVEVGAIPGPRHPDIGPRRTDSWVSSDLVRGVLNADHAENTEGDV